MKIQTAKPTPQSNEKIYRQLERMLLAIPWGKEWQLTSWTVELWVGFDQQRLDTETLLTDLARFRDIEIGPEGQLYILLEHKTGGQIIRLVPVAGDSK